MRLAARLALAVAAVTVVVSLFPFAAWRPPAAPWWSFVFAPLPRVLTPIDLVGNVLAYVPLGALALFALRPALGIGGAVPAALAGGVLLSLALEVAQNFLPGRVPSNVDVLCNALGTALGIFIGIRWRHRVERGGTLHYAWQQLRAEGQAQESGLAVLAVWWLAQWSPGALPLQVGAWREAFDWPALAPFSVDAFIDFEAAIVVAGALAGGLCAALMLRRHRRRTALLTVLAALVVKGAGMALMGAGAFVWLTPGTLRGLAVGAVLLLALATLRPGLQRMAAVMSVLIVLLLTNFAPDNPYHLPSLPGWPASQWLNLDGLSRLAGLIWPFIALAWLARLRTET